MKKKIFEENKKFNESSIATYRTQGISFRKQFRYSLTHEWGNDQEVEFHEIEIQLFQEVEFSIMRSKFLIMNFCKIDQEIELALGALRELG